MNFERYWRNDSQPLTNSQAPSSHNNPNHLRQCPPDLFRRVIGTMSLSDQLLPSQIANSVIPALVAPRVAVRDWVG